MKINYMWVMHVTSNAMEAYYDYSKACKNVIYYISNNLPFYELPPG